MVLTHWKGASGEGRGGELGGGKERKGGGIGSYGAHPDRNFHTQTLLVSTDP